MFFCFFFRYADKYISRCTPILSGCKSEMFNNELSTSAALGQFQKKLSVVESKDDSVQKSSTTEDEQTKPDISHVKSDTPATHTVRRAPVTKPEVIFFVFLTDNNAGTCLDLYII